MRSKKYLRSLLFVMGSLQLSAYAAPAALKFSEACSPEQNIEILAVGDILLHEDLQRQAVKSKDRFKSLWSEMIPYISKADIAYANLEGPVAEGITRKGKIKDGVGFEFDNEVYTEYARFNYHPFLIKDIKESGFDIVSTANNHSLDRNSLGVDKTIAELKKNDLLYTGTLKVKTAEQEKEPQWHTITESKGHRIAWLACTFSTNQIEDTYNQVLPCFSNQARLLKIINSLSNDPDIDAVIVTPHWGQEYELQHNEKQSALGRKMIEAGATAVLATHPHVVQPWEKVTAKDGREGLIVYSTGNFVSGQGMVKKKTSIMVQLHLTGAPHAKLKIRGASYLPMFMQRSPTRSILPVYDLNSVPELAKKIWLDSYSEDNRIKSLKENQIKKFCPR